jgi:energy-converting hydrogenase A subunit M
MKKKSKVTDESVEKAIKKTGKKVVNKVKVSKPTTNLTSPVKPLIGRVLDGDIDEFVKVANSCKDNTLLTYEVHVVIEDAVKKILNVRKDHGL